MRYNIKLSAYRMAAQRNSMKCIVSRDENDKKIITLAGDDNPDAMEMTQEYLLAYMRQNHLDTIGRNKLSALENGDHKAFYGMTLSQWSAFCDVFGVSFEYLTGQEPYKTPTIKALCEITGLSAPAAGLLQEWNQDKPDRISNLDALINQPDFVKVLEYMTALKATAKFSADNYYRRKNFDKVNQALAKRLTGYQPPEPDEITEKMNSTLVELARKSDIHEIGRTMENIMDMFYVKAIDQEYSRG